MSTPTDRTILQNAWVTDDAEALAQKWVNEMGVGPFYFSEYGPQLSDIRYRGEPGELSMIVAIGQAGPVQIELIQPTTSAPCAYRDSVAAGTMGFHHICVWTHDIDADTRHMESLGYATANAGNAGFARFAYYDTRPLMGCMLEVVERLPEVESMFSAIAEQGNNWDGSRPMRDSAELR